MSDIHEADVSIFRKWRKIVVVALLLIIGVPTIVYAGSWIYHMTANVGVSTEVEAYEDSGCTIPLSETHFWGEIQDGDFVEFWLKNEGNVPVNVTITISSPVDCSVVASPTFIGNMDKYGKQKITLTISTTAPGGTAINWDVQIDSEEA